MTDSNDLLIQVEALKNMLVARATGDYSDDDEYRQLRSTLMRDVTLNKLLPKFVQSCRNLSEFWGFIKPMFATYAERRAFLAEAFDPVLSMLEQVNVPADVVISERLAVVSSNIIYDHWQRALERRTSDPEGAITMARTLLESVCKHILDDYPLPYEDQWDLNKLYNTVSKQINLAPSQHTEHVFKQILGSCHGVVDGLAAIRNRLGDAHGKGQTTRYKPSARHAELCVNLAGSMATFLMSTWEEIKAKKSTTTIS